MQTRPTFKINDELTDELFITIHTEPLSVRKKKKLQKLKTKKQENKIYISDESGLLSEDKEEVKPQIKFTITNIENENEDLYLKFKINNEAKIQPNFASIKLHTNDLEIKTLDKKVPSGKIIFNNERRENKNTSKEKTGNNLNKDRKIAIKNNIINPVVPENENNKKRIRNDEPLFENNTQNKKHKSLIANSNPYGMNSLFYYEGEYKNNYNQFAQFIHDQISNNSLSIDLKSHANVSLNEDFYFDMSDEVVNQAKQFLTVLWKHDLKNLFNAHEKKTQDKKLTNAHPTCISFVLVKSEQGNFCFVSLSGWVNSPDIVEILKSTADKINKNNINNIQFQVIKDANKNFSILLENVADILKLNIMNKQTMCSEKTFLPVLTKLLYETDTPFYIDGAINCRLLPYKMNKESKVLVAYNASIKPLVHSHDYIEMKINRCAVIIPCCAECKNLKPAVLAILTSALQFRQANADVIAMSPIRNNF